MDNELVSIVIPVYNVERYLEECLDSVINQTYTKIQIICVEDASTDGSWNILKEYQKKDERIEIIINKKNRGLSYARNRGFEHAEGKYIYFLDSDDYIKNNAIEMLYQNAEHYQIDCIYFDSELLEETCGLGCPCLKFNGGSMTEKVVKGSSLFKLLKEGNTYVNSVWRRFWRTDFLIKNHLKFAEGLLAEDTLFSLKAILLEERSMVIDEVYHVYRRREGTLSTEVTSLKMISLFKNYCMLLEFWNNHEFNEDVNSIISKHLENILINAKREYVRFKEKISKENFKSGLERHLFEVLIVQEYEKSLNYIDENILEKIRSFNNVIIYGAGRYANEIIEKLKRNAISVDFSAVTSLHKNAVAINGIPLLEIKSLIDIKENSIVIIGVAGKNRKEVIGTLEELGFTNYISLD